MNKRGFTLMELTTVVTLVGILAAILLPALSRARESANRTSCLNNLVQLGQAFHMYAQENNGELPWSGGENNAECLRALYGQYVGDARTFACPSDSDHDDEVQLEATYHSTDIDASPGFRCSYDYLGAYTRAPLVAPALPAPIPPLAIMWDLCGGSPMNTPWARAINHVPAGGNVLWLDGHVEFIHRPAWAGDNLPVRPKDLDYADPSTFLQTEPTDVTMP